MLKDRLTNSNDDFSILSRGVKINGDINSSGNIRIDGSVIGNIFVDGNLTLGDSSSVKGDIKAQNLTIAGKLEGNLVIHEKVVMESKSDFRGDLQTRMLVIESGARFEGRSRMESK